MRYKRIIALYLGKDRELKMTIEKVAKARGWSVNKTAWELIRLGLRKEGMLDVERERAGERTARTERAGD